MWRCVCVCVQHSIETQWSGLILTTSGVDTDSGGLNDCAPFSSQASCAHIPISQCWDLYHPRPVGDWFYHHGVRLPRLFSFEFYMSAAWVLAPWSRPTFARCLAPDSLCSMVHWFGGCVGCDNPAVLCHTIILVRHLSSWVTNILNAIVPRCCSSQVNPVSASLLSKCFYSSNNKTTNVSNYFCRLPPRFLPTSAALESSVLMELTDSIFLLSFLFVVMLDIGRTDTFLFMQFLAATM